MELIIGGVASGGVVALTLVLLWAVLVISGRNK